MTWITIYNVQRMVTLKEGNSELWFLCSARYITVLYLCVKFQENIANCFQVTEETHIFQKSLFSLFKGP